MDGYLDKIAEARRRRAGVKRKAIYVPERPFAARAITQEHLISIAHPITSTCRSGAALSSSDIPDPDHHLHKDGQRSQRRNREVAADQTAGTSPNAEAYSSSRAAMDHTLLPAQLSRRRGNQWGPKGLVTICHSKIAFSVIFQERDMGGPSCVYLLCRDGSAVRAHGGWYRHPGRYCSDAKGRPKTVDKAAPGPAVLRRRTR
jgi:hypothetical protein